MKYPKIKRKNGEWRGNWVDSKVSLGSDYACGSRSLFWVLKNMLRWKVRTTWNNLFPNSKIRL